MSLFFFFLSCVKHNPAKPLTRYLQSSQHCDSSIFLNPESAQALSLTKTEAFSSIPLHSKSVDVVDSVFVRDTQGNLWFHDFIGETPFPNQDKCKLDLRSFKVEGIGAVVDNQWRITPYSDVLSHIDSGIGLTVRMGEQSKTLRFPPNYNASLVRPYGVTGYSQPKAASGFHPQKTFSANSGVSGMRGSTGRDGTSGTDGSDAWQLGQDGGDGGHGGDGGNGSSGRSGSSSSAAGGRGGDGGDGGNGGNGKHGGDGGDGHHGGNGGRGADGKRGENGPDILVTIRPIYSPFYLGEELVYLEVSSSGSTHNYIFHQGQNFTISTIGGNGGAGGSGGNGGDGGRGGDGGNGGRGGNGGSGGSGGSGGPADSVNDISAGPQGNGGDGGDGGDGGNGGDGGSGAPGGCGGDGGDGGRGGNGGNISVQVYGSKFFQEAVVSSIHFQSIPGNGGRRGDHGYSGSHGRAGYAGSSGAGGSYGSGGYGSKSGDSGDSGSSGRSGSSGWQSGSLFCHSQAGLNGSRGNSGSIVIKRIKE